jgi:hypothetical protein
MQMLFSVICSVIPEKLMQCYDPPAVLEIIPLFPGRRLILKGKFPGGGHRHRPDRIDEDIRDQISTGRQSVRVRVLLRCAWRPLHDAYH